MKRYILIDRDAGTATWTEDEALAEMYMWHEDHMVVDTDELTSTRMGKTTPVYTAGREDLCEDRVPEQWKHGKEWCDWDTFKSRLERGLKP